MSTYRLRDLDVPRFFYGTAWKEDETARLTQLALQAGFRGIDTANQRKHYHEAGVGEAVRPFVAQHGRDALFLQTKFTFRRGQDHRLPYDPSASIEDQVAQSFASSLSHLGVAYLDSYVLHGPSTPSDLQDDDWAAWRAMEEQHREGKTRLLGISNVSLSQLRQLCERAHIAPAFVQNRCFAHTAWDADIRAFCREQDIRYQGFSLLTANRRELDTPLIPRLCAEHQCTVAQLVFAFALGVGMVPLTGTTDATHMTEDLEALALRLPPDALAQIETLSGDCGETA